MIREGMELYIEDYSGTISQLVKTDVIAKIIIILSIANLQKPN
ncbi:MAG: hypothetical protein ACJA1Z_002838 [Patiriisocius sp.]|jgi:hypothetical protein